MKILSTSLLVSFMTVFAFTAHAGANDPRAQNNQQAKPRLANCKDCLDAGYRRGFADGEAAALENTPAGSSSVTTPLSYRKSVYVQAPSTKPQLVKAPAAQPKPQFVQAPPTKKQAHYANAPALTTAPRKLPAYVQRIAPTVQPNVPKMQRAVQRIKQHDRHAGHGHHTQAQIIDCELTDALNRSAKPVTTIISTQKHYQPAPVKQQRTPAPKPAPMKRIPNIKHKGHYHYTEAEKADCELTDALNRQAKPVSRVIRSSTHQHHSPIEQYMQKKHKHGNHWHSSEVERADCALTDTLNRGGSVVRVVHKH